MQTKPLQPQPLKAAIPLTTLFALAVLSASCGGGGTTQPVPALVDPPSVSLSSTSLTFVCQPLASCSRAQSVTLTNRGDGPLTISSITVSGDYTQTDNCGTSVAAGTGCTINVVFAPAASGTRSGTLSISDNAPGTPHTVTLSGAGVAAGPAADLSPASLTFLSQPVGTGSTAQTVILTNTANATLTISSIAITGTNASDFAQTNTCGSSAAASANCTISVTFRPSVSGSRTASVAITDNAGGSPQTVSLTGTGTAPAVNLSPASLSFGSQTVGTTSAAQTVTLTDTGNATLTITSLAVTGTNASDFAQIDTCGSSLASGANCTISVSFKPSASGSSTASVSILDNASGSPQMVNLFGTGTANRSVEVNPEDDIQSLVDQNPTGTTFSFGPGIYRLQSIVPKDSDIFIGQSGAVLSGAALLTSFSQSGAYWTTQVQVTQSSSYQGQCDSTHPACMLPEDVFFDDLPRTRVTSLSSVGPGKWYLDYSTGKVYLGDNPSGHTVEISLLPHAFSGSGKSVTINNLTIEKYACVAGDGAVQGNYGTSWAVSWSEVRHNHGMGIHIGNYMYILHCNMHDNGQLGAGGGGNYVTIQSSEIAHNNYAGYSYYWEAGGTKFAAVRHLKVQYNYFHDNNGPGLWTDINSQYVVYDGNHTVNNKEAGILHEISYDASIINNYIVNDGFNQDGTDMWWGAGILISNSSNVTITGNTIVNCMNGIGGIYTNRGNGPNGQPYLTQNLDVTGNTITQATGTAAGIVKCTTFDNSVYTSWNNHFQNNTFDLANPETYNYFFWLGEPWTLAMWDSYGSLH